MNDVPNYYYQNQQTPIYGGISEPWVTYQAKINFEGMKKQIDLEAEKCSLRQKLEFEKEHYSLKIQYDAFKKMMSDVVTSDAKGTLYYAVTAPDETKIVSRRLLNIDNFGSRIYISYHPVKKSVLEFSWGESNATNLIIPEFEEEIQVNRIIRRMKAKGVLFQVSGKAEKRAAESLIAFAIGRAEMVEVPYSVGWGKDRNGTWHFATQDEVTMTKLMRGIENYERP